MTRKKKTYHDKRKKIHGDNMQYGKKILQTYR